ncbi:MAG: hypothetical protein LBD86_05025 [Spirochaetaceae bacterium]|jgi:DNA-damage-inducible protein D|nr:hypothetical protein [Spirochaetaceae bacterium]
MYKKRMIHYKAEFYRIVHLIDGENDSQIEIWFTRELQEILRYNRRENSTTAIKRTLDSCEAQGVETAGHFRDITKMAGPAACYACYLIVQNRYSQKEGIAFAQSYFAIQTRKTELIYERLNERLNRTPKSKNLKNYQRLQKNVEREGNEVCEIL